MKRIAKYFFEGLLFVGPIAVTLYICWRLFEWLDKPFRTWTERMGGQAAPGVGFLLAVVFGGTAITLAGFLCSNIVTRSAMLSLDHVFARFPFIKLLHTSLKDLLGAFVGGKKRFNVPAAVELVPGSGVRVLGFVTREDLGGWGLEGSVAVYLPQSYNFAGNLVIVPRARVRLLQVSGADVMTLIVSGGLSGPDRPSATESAAPPAGA